MNTFDKLNEHLPSIKKEFPNINRGGCGFAALIIGSELEKRGIKVKYVLISNKRVDMETTREAIRKFNEMEYKDKNTAFRVYNNGFAICHIMVYYKGLLIDADGVCTWENSKWNDRYNLISAILDPTMIRKWVSVSKGWNTQFDRGDLPDIRKSFKHIFKIVYTPDKYGY